jgi:DNA polymerase-3 subunit alpha
MARNCGMHAAGVVISPRPLKELVPLYKTNKEEIVTQYDMKYLEKLGLLKMDFLGLTTLTIIDNAQKLIKKTRGEDLVLDDVPIDDKDTYQRIFSQGLTSGVFQFESSGMKDVLRRYQPERIEDLVALNALYRPGPIKGGVVDDFIDRKHGRKKVTYDVIETKPLLEETYGIILYQEQVMQIAQVVGGYRLGEADLLRRAMGKKKVEEMAKQRVHFMEGARERNINEKKAEKLFDLMAQFAEYGFNKSHSAAYGYLAYLTGYMKAHYAVEFMAALLTSETGNTDKVVKYINECRDLGISILQPDVNASDLNFTPDNGAIRFGLGAVKNVGSNAVQTIVEARQSGGRYKTLDDFCERVDLNAVNRRVIESLIKAGAMDAFPGSRAQKMAIIDEAMETGQRARKDRESGQAGLFGELMGGDDSSAPPRTFPNVPEWDSRASLRGEKETIGYYVTGHPLDEYRWKVKELSTHDSESLSGVVRGAEVTICGVLTEIAKKRNKEQKPWAIAQLEDWAGSTEVLIFATRYETLQSEIEEDRPVLIYGKAMPDDDGSTKVNVQEIVPLEQARVNLPSLISIRVRIDKEPDQAGQLKALFDRKQGETGVRLKLEKPKDFTLHLDVPARVLPDKEFKAEIERICGPESIEVLAS